MIDSGKVKAGVVVVLLLAALAVFDFWGVYSFQGITGAQTATDKTAYVTDTLRHGEERVYTIGGKDYTVLAEFVGPIATAKVRFKVNKEETGRDLSVGDYYVYSNGLAITVNDIIAVEEAGKGVLKVKFTLDATEKTEATEQTGYVIDALQQGEERSYTISGKVYNVRLADFVGTTAVKFTVNREASNRDIGIGQDYTYTNGVVITVTDITIEEGVRKARFTLAAPAEAAEQAAATTAVTIEPGWNIVGTDTLMNPVSTDCTSRQLLRTAYIYNPQVSGGYYKHELAGDLYQFVLLAGIAVDSSSAAYVLNGAFGEEKACNIITPLVADPHGVVLRDGWSMVGIPPAWKGKKLSEVLRAGCNVEVAWLLKGGNWVTLGDFPINMQETFNSEDIGKGFWIKATGCAIG